MKGDGALCNYDLPLPPELGLPAEMTAAGPGARTQPIPRPLTSAPSGTAIHGNLPLQWWRIEGRAAGREWRTPPLWGVGLTAGVSGHTTFLHDGRARSLLEAILWHGGEAQPHRDAVISMAPADRAALIRYLESL